MGPIPWSRPYKSGNGPHQNNLMRAIGGPISPHRPSFILALLGKTQLGPSSTATKIFLHRDQLAWRTEARGRLHNVIRTRPELRQSILHTGTLPAARSSDGYKQGDAWLFLGWSVAHHHNWYLFMDTG
jgi:hypothetical protein